jgi:dsRNA-specific ribonuclease
MPKYLVVPKMMRKHRKHQQALRTKDKADLVEAFLGALYVDRGWEWCRTFCRVCFFPRLKVSAMPV